MWFVGLGCGGGDGELTMRGGAADVRNERRLKLSEFMV